MLNWISRFNIFCFLDDHAYAMQGHQLACVAGAGVYRAMPSGDSWLHAVEQFTSTQQDWIFGHLAYPLKAETEGVADDHQDPIGFTPAFFFVPQWVVILEDAHIKIGSLTQDHEEVCQAILMAEPVSPRHEPQLLTPAMARDTYLQKVRLLQQHIQKGDAYEVNFCQSFSASGAIIDPLRVYRQLATISPNPFSAFYRLEHRYLMCASPERFLQKTGNRLRSQPIKGTVKRNLEDPEMDARMKQELHNNKKERAENVMVVDLVRNDLSRVCVEGTVRVTELFGTYAFPQVHQMISTIEGELQEGKGFTDIIRACFPMGSMTGAPKRKVLELIDQYETGGRGLFSGSVGYITPEGNFDFNVVIRSLLYNEMGKLLTYWVGSGITFYADAEREYEECMVKAQAMEQAIKK